MTHAFSINELTLFNINNLNKYIIGIKYAQ